MSYILDALRKSEQQRQATQPDTVTDRILVNQPPPKPKRGLWLTTLLISNLLVIGGLIWYFSQQSAPEALKKQVINNNSTKTAMVKQLPPEDDAMPNNNSPLLPAQPSAPTPSIAQLIENQKAAEPSKPAKKSQDKKSQSTKKENIAKTTSAPRNITETIEDEPIHKVLTKPTTQTKSMGTPDLNELPYEVRNNLPNLNVNVFCYAQQPEDRFVIIDMVKYKTGQLVKGQVKVKEIRSDSILLENTDGSTFKVERP